MTSTTSRSAVQLYLNLIKRVLVGMLIEDAPDPSFTTPIKGYMPTIFVPKWREYGRDFPTLAHSAIGLRRTENIQQCVEQVLADNIPGDLMETGVWRGGATIFMRAILMAYNVTNRTVWVADSFEGLPVPDLERYPIDAFWQKTSSLLAVSLEEVQANFTRYGLLDDQVQFLKGWFSETLPNAPVDQLAVLRLDGDLYSSTWDVLSALYDKVAPGGFVIVDDYNIHTCRQAITDYRTQFGINEPIHDIDGYGVYWRRER